MRYYDILAEALKFSQIRPYMKDWNSERYSDIFKNPKFKHDKNGYRVFFPIENSNSDNTEKSPTHIAIEKFLNENGFEIVDYIKGVVRNTEKNQNIKIGKVLNKLKATDLLNAFNVDKTREGTKSEYIVVISRHPYDIAGMSTGRGWTSCMNLDTGINRHFVPIDINAGSIVAYVTNINDPDIKNPTGRVLIKPFVDILGSPEVLFGIEERVYGTDVPGFLNSVKKWVNEINNSKVLNDVAIFKFNKDLYVDSGLATQTIIKGTKLSDEEKQKINDLTEYPHDIFNIENPSDALRIVAITSHRGFGIFREMLKYEDYIPSFKVQLAGVINDYNDVIPLMQKMYPDNKIDIKIYSSALDGMTNDNDITALPRSLFEFVDMLITYDIKLPAKQISKILNKAPKFIGEFIKQGYDFDNDYILDLVKKSKYPESIYTSLIKNDIKFGNDIDLAVINNDLTRITSQTMIKIIQINLERYNKVPEKIKDAILNRTPEMIISFLRNREKYAVSITNDEIVNCIISKYMPKDKFTSVIGSLFYEFEIKFDENQIEKLILEIEDHSDLNYILSMLNTYNLMTDDIARIALNRTYAALKFISEKTPQDYKYALRRGFGALDFIEVPSYEHIEYAIKRTYPDEFAYNSFETYDSAFDRAQLSDVEQTQLLYYLVKQVPDSIVGIIKNHEKYNLTKVIQRAAINGGSGTEMIQSMYNRGIEPEEDILVKFLEDPNPFDSLGNSKGFLIRFIDKYKNKNTNYIIPEKVLDKIFEKNTDSTVDYIIRNKFNFPIGNERLKKYLSDVNNQLDYQKFIIFMENYKKYDILITPQILKSLLEYDRGSDDYNFKDLTIKLLRLIEDYGDMLNDDMYKIILDKKPRFFGMIKNPSKELTDYAAKLEPTKKLSVGDMVRATNPKATPKFKIEEITENGYVLSFDGKIRGEFPKERIHRVNGINTSE